jgi:hypothetical protein
MGALFRSRCCPILNSSQADPTSTIDRFNTMEWPSIGAPITLATFDRQLWMKGMNQLSVPPGRFRGTRADAVRFSLSST